MKKNLSNLTAIEYKISMLLNINEFTNGGYPSELFELIRNNPDTIIDLMCSNDSLILLPSSKENAEKLYLSCVFKDEFGEISECADEVCWEKIENRWWLSLWWD